MKTQNTTQTGWNIFNYKGQWIDKVFFTSNVSKDEVKSSLVNHDGYDSNIVVEHE